MTGPGTFSSSGNLEKVWEGFVSVFEWILQNKSNDTLALKAPVEGDLNDVQTSIWPTIGSMFRNAFVAAVKGEVDHEIKYKDALGEGEEADDDDEKKWW